MKRKIVGGCAVLVGLYSLMAAEWAGVGLMLIRGSEDRMPRIGKVLPGSPAAKARIQEGLVLLSINGTNTVGRSAQDCAQQLRGAEGTVVKLELLDPRKSKTNSVQLTRVTLPALDQSKSKTK